MKIKLGGKIELVAFSDAEGKIFAINLADFSGKINFREIVREYLKGQDIFVATRTVKSESSRFLAFMKRPLGAINVLKIALRLQRR